MKESHSTDKAEITGIIRILPSFHFSIIPQKMPDGRVSFNIEGETGEYQRALQAITDNVPVGSKDVLESIRQVRTMMFQTKQRGGAR